ncbi:hypothetical protein ESY86_09840 [Subsaximicrobium wynnwilliamsii]|uniref:Acyltransferase n=1 Tax=Subsaximicrobium wynnwilliamsii TaxID=291179 RepID=A0A5C6ZJ49_9FLAO|nr:hypothetical protein [Subsaximicrobium wynnwilliamsii]TXD81371.1 hypothetical protein ESY87_18490 [Subsaximicrobium wynnwilliamsii]TXD89067.1 hypothetical protein ESY86_09840 [Subsaximicrobium wynnwilliamsii]TXE00745.1 hypothetical protein ESY88_18585 [Subsaximicrobium wynnwilliamsii]
MIKLVKQLVESFIRNIGGVFGIKLRYLYYKHQFKTCGSKIIIEPGVFFENAEFMVFGSNIWIDKNVILVGGAFNSTGRNFSQKGKTLVKWGELNISDGVHIAPFTLIQAHGGVKIGKNVTVASGSKIYSLSHHYKNLENLKDTKRYSFSSMANLEDQYMIIGNVIVGDYAAIGLNSVILPGSYIPNGTWVSVMSTVNSSDQMLSNSVFKSN